MGNIFIERERLRDTILITIPSITECTAHYDLLLPFPSLSLVCLLVLCSLFLLLYIIYFLCLYFILIAQSLFDYLLFFVFAKKAIKYESQKKKCSQLLKWRITYLKLFISTFKCSLLYILLLYFTYISELIYISQILCVCVCSLFCHLFGYVQFGFC